ncbi:hypothetical protein BC629DRAFT_1543619 [Irpex lacteus]|nr:hypothetical protein BC629DRAFT_1543619 [Irpex lacteus]
MEDIARDPEIGPQLFTLLSEKLKTTKDALTVLLRENDGLSKEITELQAQVERSRTWSKDSEEVAEDQVVTACQRGQRNSKDEVQLLRTQLATANKKLKDVEQALQEQEDKSERFKQKCERAKLRSKEKQATIDNLHEQLHQLRQRTEQLKDGHCGSLDDDGSPNSDDKGEIIVVSPNQPPIPLKWLQEPCMAPSAQPKHLSLVGLPLLDST